MENNEELLRLEQLVDTMIGRYTDLKARFHALEEKFRTAEEECEFLKLEIAELQEQRSEVGKRVGDLLGRIEIWESEQEAGIDTDVGGAAGEEDAFFDQTEQKNT